VVAIQGVNAYGSRIVAESIHCDATLPHFVPGLNGLDKEEIDLRKQELRVMVASGPFTSRTDMLYEPLDDLLNKVQERKPHALILVRRIIPSTVDVKITNSLHSQLLYLLDIAWSLR
jgi:hypothetical protein